MNLVIVLILAMVFLLAFSIGLNLGLHGVLSLGDKRVAMTLRDENHESGSSVTIGDKKSQIPLISTEHTEDPNNKRKPSVDNIVPETSFAQPLQPPNPAVSDPTKVTAIKSDTASNALPHEERKVEPLRSVSVGETLKGIYNGDKFVSALKAAHEAHAALGKSGAITDFLKSGGRVPIVLLTCNRPDQLKVTLESLFSVRGVEKGNILIAQDGAMDDIARLARQNGLSLVQNTEGLNLRGGTVDGAGRIAMHYKFSLTAAFDKFPKAPAVIIVEDDLLFSPDFYDYLTATAPILEHDPSTFVVSAWNDNGFKDRVMDPYGLRRTEFFPGLGWLLPRELYKEELERKWPREHWDHWLRSFEIHGTREIVYPEVQYSAKEIG